MTWFFQYHHEVWENISILYFFLGAGSIFWCGETVLRQGFMYLSHFVVSNKFQHLSCHPVPNHQSCTHTSINGCVDHMDHNNACQTCHISFITLTHSTQSMWIYQGYGSKVTVKWDIIPLLLVCRGFVTSNSRDREDSWFKSLFVRKVDPRKDAHSNLLTKNEESNLYKIQCKWTHTPSLIMFPEHWL